MADDTTSLSYWLNWRFFLCAIWLLSMMIVASILVWKYEGFNKTKARRRENQKETAGSLYEDETWRTCLKEIHPVWLLGYRMIAFITLFTLLTANIVIDGGGIFYFYTQWTFALVTIYFALGTSCSICGYRQYRNKAGIDRVDYEGLDAEQGSYIAPTLRESANTSNMSKNFGTYEQSHVRKTARMWIYAFQIIFQMCAGAVMLTDLVFWLILVPFLTGNSFKLNFLIVCMHSVNAVFLIGDMILNCMRFPLFRIAYFVLWTAVFVIFQWIIHAWKPMWWPYPFLDLSSPYAPAWYFGVGLMHILCYGICALIFRMKHFLLSRSFPESYQGMR